MPQEDWYLHYGLDRDPFAEAGVQGLFYPGGARQESVEQLQHLARFGDFEFLRPCPPADLLVCSDVLHYLPTRELERGLPALAELCGGVAFIEAFSRGDEAVGDDHEFKARPAAFYTTRLRALGLHPLGSHCWLSPARVEAASALELPG